MIRGLFVALFLVHFLTVNSKPEDTCYHHVGCFENGPPWKTTRRPTLPPENPEEIKPILTLYNKKLVLGEIFEVYPKVTLKKGLFDPKKDTYVIIHGFTDNGKLPWILELKDVLLKKMDVNIIIPDYSKGVTKAKKFTQAAGNIRVISRLYARAFNKTGVDPTRLHIIGHSLGAQLGSYISKEMSTVGPKVSWLTALDPAGPLFETYDEDVRLASSDAEFVDVHHSNAGVRGMVLPYGHVDFYYNFGTRQPRCEIHNEYNGVSSCYHHMAHRYYVSAVDNECLFGLPSSMKPKPSLIFSVVTRGKVTKTLQHSCYPNSCIPVGLKTKSSPQRGIFTVLTQDYPPYCSKLSPLLS